MSIFIQMIGVQQRFIIIIVIIIKDFDIAFENVECPWYNCSERVCLMRGDDREGKDKRTPSTRTI